MLEPPNCTTCPDVLVCDWDYVLAVCIACRRVTYMRRPVPTGNHSKRCPIVEWQEPAGAEFNLIRVRVRDAPLEYISVRCADCVGRITSGEQSRQGQGHEFNVAEEGT